MNNTVPFFRNLPDNMHCFQACLKMVLKYFLPTQDFSWAELDGITGKEKDCWTWPFVGLAWLTHKGFEVINIDMFCIQSFIERGEKYILDFYGQEVGNEQIKYSNIALERERAVQFAKVVRTELRLPQYADIMAYLNEGFLIIVNVNAEALNKEDGYTGHFIVITGFEEDRLFYHNPGLPGALNNQIRWTDFDRAWSFPQAQARNLVAIKNKSLACR